MTDTNQLEARIKSSGLKKEYIATQLGVSRAWLTKCIKNEAEFRVSQVNTLCVLLNIDDAERSSIFFNQNGA